MTKLQKTFVDPYNVEITVHINRSNIVITTPNDIALLTEVCFNYDADFIKYFQEACNLIWKNFTPKEANSFASDYDEYYDSDFDQNGYLSIYNKHLNFTTLYNTNRLYKFNKRHAQSFLYDLLHK